MGVPKFYRWVSERYPCLSQVVQEHQIPEFDNMYLDMNGIIHPCSHPNDDDPHFRITEEQIFANIFHYIEVLFQIIKPKKVFFMAVDGVAPRAKMNQQRGRRFRSAREAEDNIRKALAKGQVLPKEQRFDSNCITPGTVFMARLQKQLQYFVNDKITNDPAWQGLRVYLSGQQTPGEGEHKIMEFIRTERTRADYDPNTRHCLYGLDADLMMLGLTSHEPHFSLLREEVRFGKTSKRIEKPEQITFHLLHLSLFREYLDWEFNQLKTNLSFNYDLERIIDDWILMGFLVGNDFIPHLPYMHINHDALPTLFRVYKEVMPSLDGYLHDGGILNLARFEKYLQELSKYDRDKFGESFVDMKWFEAKVKHKFGEKQKPKAAQLKPKALGSGGTSTNNMFSGLDALADKFEQFKIDSEESLSPELAALAAKMDDDDDEDEKDVDEFEIEFAMHKKNYYSDKFDIEHVDVDVVANIAWEYIRGIQWILHYYFNGVQSWSWYYPFHYAPFLSDVKGFSHYQLPFDMGTPFLPFEQLLGVLPAASKELLPVPLQNLMIMEQSPIIDFYPLNFKTDLNGKQQEWEAVVLIPFIDENRLLEAMHPLYRMLTQDEKTRNRHGPFHLYTYDKDLSEPYPSTLPGVYPDISRCHARCETADREEIVTLAENLQKGLLEGVKLEVYFPGFPTLHHVHHTGELKKASVKVFQMHSRSNSMILKIQPMDKSVTIRVAERLLGETCYVGWPHMVEALVVGVSDNTFRYSHKRGTKDIEQDVLTDEDGWIKHARSFTQSQMERRGIDVGPIDVLVEACPIVGRRFICSAKGQVTLEKEWSPMPKQYALQSVVKDISVHESVSEDSVQTIEQLFPVDSSCFMLAMPHYGCCGNVLEVDTKQGRVRVQLKVPEEPDIKSVTKKRDELSIGYLPSHVVAQKMGIASSLLGKITAKYFIEQGSREKSKGQGNKKVDIGLNMKLTKQNKELLGYTRRTEQGWLFSQAARNVISQYLRKFPRLFEALGALQQADQCYESDLINQGLESSLLPEVEQWIKTLPLTKQRTVTCGSDILDDPILEAIEEAVKKAKESKSSKSVKVRVRPYVLFRPSDYLGTILPDSDTEFQLFDRVVNVKLNSAVPYGLRGTIVGFHIGEEDELIEVMFDENFIGAQSIRRTTNGMYLTHRSSLIDLTFGERQEMRKRGIAASPPRPLKQSFASALGVNRSPQRGSPKNGSPRTQRHMKQGTREDKLDPSAPGVLHIMPNGPTPDRHSSPSASGRSEASHKEGRTGSPSGRTQGRTPNAHGRTPNPAGRTSQGFDKGRHRKDVPPRFAKNTDNSSEFASMWKELQLKENSPPDTHTSAAAPSTLQTERIPKQQDKGESKQSKDLTSDTASNDTEEQQSNSSSSVLAKEHTQVLCDLLQIGKKSSVETDEASKQPSPPSTNTEPQQTGAVRALSLDELFNTPKSASKQSRVPSSPSQEGIIQPTNALASWCATVGLPPPTFHYSKSDKGFAALVELANGFKFPGTPCNDRSEAAHSAAAVALSQMPRMMPLHPAPVHPPMHPLIGAYPPNAALVPRMRGVPPPMFGYPMHPMGPLQHFPRAGPPPHMIARQQQEMHHRNTTPRKPHPHHGAVNEDGKCKTSDAGSSPFIPLQVTRRNVTPKTTTVTQQNTEAAVTQEVRESTPQKTITEMLSEAITRSKTEEGVPTMLGAPSLTPTAAEHEGKTTPIAKDAVDGNSAVGNIETKELGTISKVNQSLDVASSQTLAASGASNHQPDAMASYSTPPNDATKAARRPQSAGRSKPLMAPSFFQKKKA